MNDIIDQVYGLLASRELADSLSAVELARPAAAEAEGNPRLALHEAMVEGLDVFLSDLGEHGAANWPSWGLDPVEVSPEDMVAECAAAWDEVKRLRAAGANSEGLISKYVDGWVHPVGGRKWLARLRQSVPCYAEVAWLERAAENVRLAREAAGEDDE